jgi:hypothetical protein
MMDVRFTLRSLQQVLDKIPVNQPAVGTVDIDFSKLSTPYHIKDFLTFQFNMRIHFPMRQAVQFIRQETR